MQSWAYTICKYLTLSMVYAQRSRLENSRNTVINNYYYIIARLYCCYHTSAGYITEYTVVCFIIRGHGERMRDDADIGYESNQKFSNRQNRKQDH